MSMLPPYNQTRVTGVTEVLIGAGRVALIELLPENTTTGTITLRDAAAIGSGVTAFHTCAVGVTQLGKPFSDGIKLMAGLTVQLSAGGDAVTVIWAPYP